MPQNLYKSRQNKVFAGVCGGIAEYFRVDVTLIRLAWALAFFLGGTGLILYILAVIIMPDDPRFGTVEERTAPQSNEANSGEKERQHEPSPSNGTAPNKTVPGKGEEKRRQILGLILVALGGYFLLERFFPVFAIRSWWPLILILFGVYLLIKGDGSR